jgi:sulfur carrier protein
VRKEYRRAAGRNLEYGIANILVKGSCRSENCVVGFHKVQVKLLPQNKIITFQGSMRVLALLRKLALTPETVLVIRGNHLLTEDELIQADDEIEIRSVISGGV